MENTSATPKLHYLVKEPKLKTEKPPLLILLHGIGSNEEDLFSFAYELPDNYLVVSARAPFTLAVRAYAWFHIDFRPNGAIIDDAEVENSRKLLIQFIDDLKQVEQFDENQIYLVGFSQGGIMSYSLALTEPEKVAGIAVMSGRLLPGTKALSVDKERLNKLKIFISHGIEDPVLPFSYTEGALNFLKEKELEPEFHSYHAGHTINREMLDDLIKWLNQ